MCFVTFYDWVTRTEIPGIRNPSWYGRERLKYRAVIRDISLNGPGVRYWNSWLIQTERKLFFHRIPWVEVLVFSDRLCLWNINCGEQTSIKICVIPATISSVNSTITIRPHPNSDRSLRRVPPTRPGDRKSTRLNSSH